LANIAKADCPADTANAVMQSCLALIPDDIERVYLAYSGGLDSSVLLHLLVSNPHRYSLIPWHVNHGLLEVAGRMEQFCVEQSQRYGLELRLDHLDLGNIDSNIEAEARRQRYRLFAAANDASSCIVTAHHADDQAETFLLNALRGSGSAGLRGIARSRELGSSLLLRPLLEFSRQQLEDYATHHELAWFNDPSNRDNRFDRNYLRNEVIPAIRARWPTFQRSLSTTSRLQAEAQQILDEVAQLDYQALARISHHSSTVAALCDIPGDFHSVRALNSVSTMPAHPSVAKDTWDTTFHRLATKGGEKFGLGKVNRGVDFTLNIEGLLQLSDERARNLLRYWVASAGLGTVPGARLREVMSQLHAKPGSMPQIAMPEYSIRSYDQRLFLVRNGAVRECQGIFEFGLNEDISIDEFEVKLCRADLFRLLRIDDQAQRVTLRYPGPGQQPGQKRGQRSGKPPDPRPADRHRLKRLYQKHRIPPWVRPSTAQVYLDDKLVGLLP
jgi:tRNA(Ile)-lysidine synthetase-like protein